MADQTLLDKVRRIMYGRSVEVMDLVTRTMFGYDSKMTATGKTPDVVILDPKISDANGFSQQEHVAFTFGRFSVPSAGHAKLIERVITEAGTGPHYIFASHSHDPYKNPLPFDVKVSFMEAFWPEANIYKGDDVRNFFQAIKYLEEQGFKSATMIVGQDRYVEFSKLLEQYTNEYNMIIGIMYVERTDDDVSATKLREAVLREDYKEFIQLLPNSLPGGLRGSLWEEVRANLQINEAYKDHRRCTAHTIRAIADYHGVEHNLPDGAKAPIEGLGVIQHFPKIGLKVTGHHDQRHVGKTVKDFVKNNPTGAHYISTRGHAMAVTDGKLHDSSGKGPDGRKVQSHFEIKKNELHEAVTTIMNRVPTPTGEKPDTGPLGMDSSLQGSNSLDTPAGLKRRKTRKRTLQIIDNA